MYSKYHSEKKNRTLTQLLHERLRPEFKNEVAWGGGACLLSIMEKEADRASSLPLASPASVSRSSAGKGLEFPLEHWD